MAQAVHARLDLRYGADRPAAETAMKAADALPSDLRVSVHEDLTEIERDWRAFEIEADGTVFQTFNWLSTWQRHIGARISMRPAIVFGRDTAGLVFLLPLATRSVGFARELTWLGSELCDYNAPLLASDFSRRVGGADFTGLWCEIARRLQADARHRFDLVNLSKMPATVGSQANPMLALRVTVNPSGAYATSLVGDWETWYAAKRSSTTRRRDRTKRKKLGEFGEVRMVTPDDATEIVATVDTLMTQKARLFAHMGVANLFAKPGHAEFYRALGGGETTRPLVHVSRLDVGATPAAINLGLMWRGCYYHLLASYDEGELSRFGPGAAHLHELLRLAIERGCAVFDFTIGDERYKRDWCDREITLYDHIAAVNARGASIALPWLAGQRLKRFIKQTPVLWSIFSKARAFKSALTQRSSPQKSQED